MDTFDLIIVGGGPAGLSAALNGAARGGRCAVLSNPAAQNPLWRAERIDNYSGMPGEETWLGRGLSYCATCDGRLYQGRRVLVTGDAADLAEEAAFLQQVGCRVTAVTRRPLPHTEVPAITAKRIALWTDHDRLLGLEADGEQLPADGVFLLRQVSAPATLLPGLKTDGRFIAVDRRQQTNIPGCYAAGDCTGQPLQVAKAVGEGLVAAQTAMRSLADAE